MAKKKGFNWTPLLVLGGIGVLAFVGYKLYKSQGVQNFLGGDGGSLMPSSPYPSDANPYLYAANQPYPQPSTPSPDIPAEGIKYVLGKYGEYIMYPTGTGGWVSDPSITIQAMGGPVTAPNPPSSAPTIQAEGVVVAGGAGLGMEQRASGGITYQMFFQK